MEKKVVCVDEILQSKTAVDVLYKLGNRKHFPGLCEKRTMSEGTLQPFI